IAEPWDVGAGGYRVGRFPPLWSEWNGKYRDAVRSFWRGDHGMIAELATRFAGSSDLYASNGRRPFASVNFVTAHDGFTLRDLVSYERKHNERNGEDNRDGENDNRSWNCGVEGPTDDSHVTALRARQQRNLLATLLLSQGVPQITAGDELGRTQGGNNNAYCHDDATNWVDWEHRDKALRDMVRTLVALRTQHPIFRRRAFFWDATRPSAGAHAEPDVGWFRPDGTPMTVADWEDPRADTLSVYLNGDAYQGRDPQGNPIADDTFFVVLTAHHGPVEVRLPAALTGLWKTAFDTAEAATHDVVGGQGGILLLDGPSVRVLKRVRARDSIVPSDLAL
ncbi:MAG TPA: glycogen debranching enzyme GlgX, partial [Polyangiaceae bacterium]